MLGEQCEVTSEFDVEHERMQRLLQGCGLLEYAERLSCA